MTGSERKALIEKIGELELADYIPVCCDQCMYWANMELSHEGFAPSVQLGIGHCPRITQEVFDGLSISHKRIPIYTDASASCEFFAPSDDAIDNAISDWQEEQAIRDAVIRVKKQPI